MRRGSARYKSRQTGPFRAKIVDRGPVQARSCPKARIVRTRCFANKEGNAWEGGIQSSVVLNLR